MADTPVGKSKPFTMFVGWDAFSGGYVVATISRLLKIIGLFYRI